jgi:ATP-dependent Lon protease
MFDQRFKIQTAFEDQNEGFDEFEQAIPLMSEEEERKLSRIRST